MNNKSTCALCLKEKDLIKSHIFPEFLYKPMYDDKHNYLIVSTAHNKEPIKRQKGIYEKLMCEECDSGIIGKYEDYAAKILFEDNGTKIKRKKEDIGFKIFNIDYSLFKLFQISLLWRASITTRREFKTINLGPHRERLRRMLLTKDPGKIFDYGCMMCFIPHQPKEMIGFIFPPEPLPRKLDGHQCYRAIFNGLFWLYVVSSHSNVFKLKELFLQENGILPIVNSKQYGKRFIYKLATELIESNEKLKM